MNIRRLLAFSLILIGCLSLSGLATADGSYGSGSYGSCQYGSCSITLTSSGAVSLNITPGSGTTCTVASDTVGVTTDSSTGYTLTLADADAANQLTDGGGHAINATSGTGSSPATLAAQAWGYRVDGVNGFGSGPTSAVSNGSIPAVKFAAVPLSTGTSDTLATTTGPADPAVDTTVWFGACTDTTLPAGNYTDSVTYTAVVN